MIRTVSTNNYCVKVDGKEAEVSIHVFERNVDYVNTSAVVLRRV